MEDERGREEKGTRGSKKRKGRGWKRTEKRK